MSRAETKSEKNFFMNEESDEISPHEHRGTAEVAKNGALDTQETNKEKQQMTTLSEVAA